MSSLEVHITDEPGRIAGQILADALAQAIEARGRARLAIPGGGSPVPVFRWLVEGLPASTVDKLVLTWVDERHVPHEGEDWRGWPAESNRRLAHAEWLSHLTVAPQTVPMSWPGTLEAARAAYASAFEERLGGLDVVLLGVGGDGHIASLFPGHASLDAPGPVLAEADSPKPPSERLSLSLPALEDADCVVLVALGAAKSELLHAVFLDEVDVPLARLNPRGGYHWVLDPAAGAALTGGFG